MLVWIFTNLYMLLSLALMGGSLSVIALCFGEMWLHGSISFSAILKMFLENYMLIKYVPGAHERPKLTVSFHYSKN